MCKLFWIALILCTAMVVGCGGGTQQLTDAQLAVKKVEAVKDGNYVLYIADPQQDKEVRKLFLDHNICTVRILEDVEKGAPVYADAKYYINQNGPPNAKRVYKEVIIHLHAADEINGNVKKD